MTAILLTDQATALAERDRRDELVRGVQTRAAKAGFALVITVEFERPAFIVVRWGWCRAFADLDSVTAFLDQAGVPA